jgi:hypothetical protein
MPTQAYCFHMNEVFANHSKEDEIYPLTTEEIAEAQQADVSLKHLFKRNAVTDQGLEIKLIETMTCVCKDGWLVVPKPLQVHKAKWYHHYLQHPGHTSQGDNEYSDVLERYAYHHPVINNVLQILPD